jgi:hypothetical protein
MIGYRLAVLPATLFLASCAALNAVHDPQSGLITRAQVPKLLQSVRCELITFYDANEVKQNAFKAGKPIDYAFFPLDETQLSAVFLDLKVIDNIGIPSGSSGTNVNQTFLSNGGVDKRTWHLGPTVSDTNTYELNWPFVIPQDAKLDLSKIRRAAETNDYFPCYRPIPKGITSEDLAWHKYPDFERFSRIFVDGTEPLAGWLLNNSGELGTALFPRANGGKNEKMFPAQMIYTFTVQFGFGADASLSLITARWNPIALDIAGSTQQTSVLTIYVNGYDSLNANGARTGIIQTAKTPGVVPFEFPPAAEAPKCPSGLCSNGHPTYPLAIPLPSTQ